MTVLKNLDYEAYTRQVVKLSKSFRYCLLDEQKLCLRWYPEVVLRLPNPNELEMFIAVMMRPILLLFFAEPPNFVRIVAMALDPPLMKQLSAHQAHNFSGKALDLTISTRVQMAAAEFDANSFNVTRHYPKVGHTSFAMAESRSRNLILKGYFVNVPMATHQEAMQQVYSVLTLARELDSKGQKDKDGVGELVSSLPSVNHWALPMMAAALGVYSPAYGKLAEQPNEVLQTIFAFNGADAYFQWAAHASGVPIPARCWEAVLGCDGFALNFLSDRDYQHRADPSAKLCSIALSNASGFELLLFEGGSRSRSFKKLVLDKLRPGRRSIVDRAAFEYPQTGNLAKGKRLRKGVMDFLKA